MCLQSILLDTIKNLEIVKVWNFIFKMLDMEVVHTSGAMEISQFFTWTFLVC